MITVCILKFSEGLADNNEVPSQQRRGTIFLDPTTLAAIEDMKKVKNLVEKQKEQKA